MCIEGSFEIEYDGFKHTYIKGDTVLVPAAINAFVLSGKASILEIYIS
jgi:mannose-6-phosphate isomerase